jgi:nucleoid DNA-binding protein
MNFINNTNFKELNMTKDEMVRKIAEECGISIKKAKEALQSFLEGITESLIKL